MSGLLLPAQPVDATQALNLSAAARDVSHSGWKPADWTIAGAYPEAIAVALGGPSTLAQLIAPISCYDIRPMADKI